MLHQRIYGWAEQADLLPDNQFGFRKGRSTADNLFILTSLIQRHKLNRKPFFTVFVDFSKAFDMVSHQHLWKKLKEMGMSASILHVLEDMYRGLRSCVQTPGGCTDFFMHKRGVRQGCILSPLLFALFTRDLEAHMKQSRLPGVTIRQTQIRTLMFADDVAIVASTPDDLQVALNALKEYTEVWGLKVNKDKTKVMVFGTPERSVFQFDGAEVEQVSSYRYLGLHFYNKGPQGIRCLAERAKRGMFMLLGHLKWLRQGKLDPGILLHIFDTMVKPIFEYNAEIWVHNINKPILAMLERIQLRFCKYVLGVGRSTPTLAVLGELGRYPISVGLQIKKVAWWNRVSDSPSDMVKDCIEMGSAMNLPWYTHALAEVHMTTEIPRQDTEFVTNFIQRLQSSHKEEWAYNIQGYIQTRLLCQI